jgi:hypothetical protein
MDFVIAAAISLSCRYVELLLSGLKSGSGETLENLAFQDALGRHFHPERFVVPQERG